MNLNFLKRILQCIHCDSDDLDYTDVCFDNPLKLSGKITCSSCLTSMPFLEGVLIAGNKDWTVNQKRNAYVYSDFWEKSDKAIKYQRVTHEDELLECWRKEFNNGTLLDAGCGSGRHLSHWVKPDVKADSFVMIDISDSIFQCRKYYEEIKCSKPVLFIQSAVNKIPIKKGSISNTWSSGVLGLVENQQNAVNELCRVTKTYFLLGVLTEKTIAGKIYIAANLVKPIINRINNMNLLFLLSALIARVILFSLRLLKGTKLNLSFIRKEHLNNIINDPKAIARLQCSLYDPIIIPKIIKYPDSKYIQWSEENDFKLKLHQTEIICDYYHFTKDDQKGCDTSV